MKLKLPIGVVAKFALNRIVIPAIGRAIADRGNPLTINAARKAVADAIVTEGARQIAKRGV